MPCGREMGGRICASPCLCISHTQGKNPRAVPCVGGRPSPGICRGDTKDTQGLDFSQIPQEEDQGNVGRTPYSTLNWLRVEASSGDRKL